MSLLARLEQHRIWAQPHDHDLYLLAQASANPGLLGRLEFHAAPHYCLWYLKQDRALEKHAPWLFQLSPGSELDTWLGKADQSLAFTVIDSSLSLEALARHLRRFGKVQQGRQRYWLRLGDPCSLHLYASSLARQPEALAQLFDHGRLRTLYFHAPHKGLALGVQPVFEQQRTSYTPDGCLAWLEPKREDHT